MATQSDYDSGEITDREQTASDRQKDIAKFNINTLQDTANYNKGTAKNVANWTLQQQRNLADTNAARTTENSEYNAQSAGDQMRRQIMNYNFANRQNRALRDTEFTQARQKGEVERFNAQRNLRNAALGLMGSMGNQALNSSSTGNLMYMLNDRNDADNLTYWQQLRDNINAIQNAYDESYNQNQVAKRDAAINAINTIEGMSSDLAANLNNIDNDLTANIINNRGDLMTQLGNIMGDYYTGRRNVQGDLAANLNNINPNLYEEPTPMNIPTAGYQSPSSVLDVPGVNTQARNNGNGSASGSTGTAGAYALDIAGNGIYQAPGTNEAINAQRQRGVDVFSNTREHNARLLDSLMPPNAAYSVRNNRNRLGGNDYFSQLVNGFNNR